MSDNEKLKQIEDVERNHAFWLGEALKAWQEMAILAFDFTSQSTEQFRRAKDRCDLARSRARREFLRLSLDTTDSESPEETGQPL